MHHVCFASLIACVLIAASATAGEKTVTGEIKSVDAAKNSVEIEGNELTVTRKTAIVVDGKKSVLADIKSGQHAKVTYDDALDVAISIVIGKDAEDATTKTMKSLQGEWKCVAGEVNGKAQSKGEVKKENRTVTIKDHSLKVARTGPNGTYGEYVGKFEINPANGDFDWIGKGPGGALVEWIGIYELRDEKLKLCFIYQNEDKAKRPKNFKTSSAVEPDLHHVSFEFTRESADSSDRPKKNDTPDDSDPKIPKSSQQPKPKPGSRSDLQSKFIPPDKKCLIIIGQDKPAVESYVRQVGHQPAGVMAYDGITYLGLDDATALRQAFPHAVIQIGLALTGVIDDVPSGRFDDNLEKLATWAKKNPCPIFLRPGYECDGAHNKYAPAAYIAAFRHIRKKLDERGVENIAYVWHVLPGKKRIEDWWPGEEYVDWVAMTYFAAQKQQMAPIAAFAKKYRKPLMLAEAAPRGIGTVQGRQSWNQWFKPCFEDIAEYDVQALCYINWDWESHKKFKGGGWGDTRIEQNEFVKTNWQKEVSKPRYLAGSDILFQTLGLLVNESPLTR